MDILKKLFGKFTKEKENTSMEKINELYQELQNNALEIDKLTDTIIEMENTETDPDKLEDLYVNEFMLYMKNVGLYEDLNKYIDNEPKTLQNQFELRRIKKESDKLLKVEVIQI